jgi:hypothetical protein
MARLSHDYTIGFDILCFAPRPVTRYPNQSSLILHDLNGTPALQGVEAMNRKILGLLAACCVVGPLTATAQTTTLDYLGYVMGGTSTLLPANYVGPVPLAPLQTISTIGAFDAQVTFSGSVDQNDLAIVSVHADFTGYNGNVFQFTNLGGGPNIFTTPQAGEQCQTESFSVSGCVNLTTSGEAVTGATFALSSDYIKGSNYKVIIGPNGDSFSYSYPNQPVQSCTPVFGSGEAFTGSTTNPPCTVNVSNPTAGVWSVASAPEIDPKGMAGGLTLLLGSLAVLRGRRRFT